MRVLLARFHPRKKSGDAAIPVGRVVCEDGGARIEPLDGADGDEAISPALNPMLEKLRFLVQRSGVNVYDRLRTLRSEFWSFEEIASGDSGRNERPTARSDGRIDGGS